MRNGEEQARWGDVEWRLLLGRVLELPEAQQLRMHQALSEALGGRLGRESKRASEARSRLEAVEAIREAAVVLGLPPGEAPNVEEFKRVARGGALSMSFRTVYGAFEERWELATRLYEERPIPLSPAQRAIKREVKRGHGANLQAPIVGLRMWLEDSPADTRLSASDYQEWAIEHNERRSAGERRVIEETGTISRRLRLSWPRALAVAQGEIDLEVAQEEDLAERLGECGPLVGVELACYLLELKTNEARIKRPGYPRFVARLGRTPHWLLDEIRAYQQEKRTFDHAPGSLEGSYLDSHEVAEMIGVHRYELRSRLNRERLGVKQRRSDPYLPPPAGLSGARYYWDRAAVEAWLAEREARREERLRDAIALRRPARHKGGPKKRRA
jgi:predicted DNA-binding transcriptional regulator AlpA